MTLFVRQGGEMKQVATPRIIVALNTEGTVRWVADNGDSYTITLKPAKPSKS